MRTALWIALSLAVACRRPVEQPAPLDNDGDGVYANQGDCDDANAEVYPGALEICDGLDNDCDEEVDQDAVDARAWFTDGDGDGYGLDESSLTYCNAPDGTVGTGGDCDDGNAEIHPEAPETDCSDPTDYNCDGSSGYADIDGDGHPACQDCRDDQSDIFPGADEVCDDRDNDCDDVTDEADAVDALTWYADADHDGYGDPASVAQGCDQPAGYIADDQDCDDTSPQVSPIALETCDGRDNNCDGEVDSNAIDAFTWYLDEDGDDYGNPLVTVAACEPPQGYIGDDLDCDDSNAAISPDGIERCNGIDDNCDGDVDDDPVDPSLWYGDADGDGFPGSTYTIFACSLPEGFHEAPTDCDDADTLTYPGAPEGCDGLINNCDSTQLPSAEADLDGDGRATCEGDCDDTRNDVNLGAPETCDSADNDCDGQTDEADAVDAERWYADGDNDGFGGSHTVLACAAPLGFVATRDDCDDSDTLTYPGATEICDGVVNDCGASLPMDEADLDGDGVSACEGDCNDSRDDVGPHLPERCDDTDNDCDGAVDEGDAIDSATWYLDADRDGFGGPRTLAACAAPLGYVGAHDDCDDQDATTYPGATEVCDGVVNDCDESALPADETDGDGDGVSACEGDCDDARDDVGPHRVEVCDGVDNNCDVAVDEADAINVSPWYADADHDGYGGTTIVYACAVPLGFVDNDEDCDDLHGDISPVGEEVCDGVDNDCDAVIDNRDLVLGSGAACAARHCADVLENAAVSDSGVYWLNSVGKVAPYQAYCEMDLADGGWTLALKADGRQTTFSYDAAYWTDANLLNPTSLDLSHTQAKLAPFLSMPMTEVMLGLEYPIAASGDLSMTSVVLPKSSNSLREVFSSSYSASSLGRSAWKATISGSSLQPNCNTEGFNVYHSYSRVRIGIHANQENDCGSPDSRIGIGGQGGACGQADGLSVGNTARCSPDNGDKDLYAWGALFVRCDMSAPDLLGDGLDQNCDGVDGQDLDGDGEPSLASGGGDCDDTDPNVFFGQGCTLAASCLDLYDAGESASHVYTLEPEPGVKVATWCDMADGGWTLAFYKNSAHATPIFSTAGGYFFGKGYEGLTALAGDPAARSSSATPYAGWLDVLATDAEHLRLSAWDSGVRTYVSDPIALAQLNVEFGENGYLLWNAPADPVRPDGQTYYWCGGDATYTDAGVGQINQPAGAPGDCKSHGSLGSGWDFSRTNGYNQGLTLCGGDASSWMHGGWATTARTFPTPGSAQAIWVR